MYEYVLFQEAWKVMKEQFNSLRRENRVKRFLHGLWMTRIIKTKKGTGAQRLEQVWQFIAKLTFKCLKTHICEKYKIDYHQDTVLGLHQA